MLRGNRVATHSTSPFNEDAPVYFKLIRQDSVPPGASVVCSLHASLEIGTQARIPKGFRPKAQGCEERATLGNSPEPRANPERVVALSIPRAEKVRPQPFQGWLYARVPH